MTNVAPGDRGLVSSVMLAVAGLVGSGMGPFMVGVVSDALSPIYGDEGLRYAIAVMIPTPAIALALLWLAIRQARGAGLALAT